MDEIAKHEGAPPSRLFSWLKIIAAAVIVYFFLSGVNMMGSGLKLIGKEHADFIEGIFSYAENPLVGLFVGILITSIFQSSSFTTSFTVGLVAAGQLSLHNAIPIIMGANIGTSVTNALVSFGHIRRKDEFQRAFAGAIVHDNFNLLSVILFFPIEIMFHPLEHGARYLSAFFASGNVTATKPTNWLKEIIRPFVGGVKSLLVDVLDLGPTAAGTILGILGVVLLFLSLFYLVKILRSLVLAKAERFFGKYLFRNAVTAYAVGVLLTVSVQSSSVTTSLVVPLIGAGLLTLPQIFPYVLGANLGTTVTALLASFAAASQSQETAQFGLAVAMAHLMFNIGGTCVFWPLKAIPIGMANWLASLCRRSRKWPVLWVVGILYILPTLAI
ncbi:MAG: Na/Pi symporter, partial [Phycisphaerae bacterium]|nr:Na/Pi symporter [Phycisphaerae bacterium]